MRANGCFHYTGDTLFVGHPAASDTPRNKDYCKDPHTQLHDCRFLHVASPYLLQVYREVRLTEVQTDTFVLDVVVLFLFG